jgi:hypothetical protein
MRGVSGIQLIEINEMTYNSTIRLSQIDRVARALYDAAPSEGDPPSDGAEQSLDEQAEPTKALSWDELDDAQYPIKQEFRAMATIAVEAITEAKDDELDETLRQFQLPAVMAELTALSKADALRVLYAAIEKTMETR